jgi:hypothetical protein
MLTGEPIFGMQSAESIAVESTVASNFSLVDGGITAYAPNGEVPLFASNALGTENSLLSFHYFGEDGPPAEVYCQSVRCET